MIIRLLIVRACCQGMEKSLVSNPGSFGENSNDSKTSQVAVPKTEKKIGYDGVYIFSIIVDRRRPCCWLSSALIMSKVVKVGGKLIGILKYTKACIVRRIL